MATRPAIWFQEAGPAARWHRIGVRLPDGRYRMACGIEMTYRQRRIWSQKVGEEGPALESRCPICAIEVETE